MPKFSIYFGNQTTAPPASPSLGWEQVNTPLRRRQAFTDGRTETLVPLQRFFPVGWEVAPHQPAHPAPERRAAATMRGDDGNADVLRRFFSHGNVVQPPQPPSRPRRLIGWPDWNEDGNESKFQNWKNAGWEIAPPQPPHPRRERISGAMAAPITPDAVQINFVDFGWPVQHPQPPHPRPERSAAVAGPVFIDAAFAGFFAVAESHPPFVKQKPRWERAGAIQRGDDGNQFPEITFSAPGWEVQSVQPPHLRSEKAGAIMPIEPGNEGIFTFVTSPPTTAWDVQPTPFRFGALVQTRYGALARGDDGTADLFRRFFSLGFPIQDPQPPRPARRLSPLLRGDDGTQAQQIAFFPFGWPVQPYQPQHPRPERAGAIMVGHSGIDPIFSLVPAAITWGFEPSMPLPGWRRKVLTTAEDVVASRFAVFRPMGFEPAGLMYRRPPRINFAVWSDGVDRIRGFQPFAETVSSLLRRRPNTSLAAPETILRGTAAAAPPAWGWELVAPVLGPRRQRPMADAGEVIVQAASPLWGWADMPGQLRRMVRYGLVAPAPGQPEAPVGVPAWGWEGLPSTLSRAVRAALARQTRFPLDEFAPPLPPPAWGWLFDPILLPGARPSRGGAGLIWSFFERPPFPKPLQPDLSFAADEGLWRAASADSPAYASEGFDAALFSCAAHESIDGTPAIMGTYEIQTALQVVGTFADSLSGGAADPTTITLLLRSPTGVVQTLTYPANLTRDDVGEYSYSFTPSVHGTWTYKWQGTGDVVATSPDTSFTVKASTLIGG